MPLRDLRIVIVMFDIRNYRPGFELSAFVLSIAILLPNLIWYFIPAPTDLFAQQHVVHFAIKRRFHRAAIARHADGNLPD